MKTPPKLPSAPVAYDKDVFNRLIRSIEQFFDAVARPGAGIATGLRLTALPGATTLAAGILAGDASMTLNDATNFPMEGSGTLGAEKFSWSNKSGSTLTGVTRGIAGTTATSHSLGAVVVASAVEGTVYADPATNALHVVV